MKNDITDKYDGLIPAGTRPDTADAELQELWDVTREMHSGRNVVTEDETEACSAQCSRSVFESKHHL